jgi:predicted phosphodiesterase
MMKFAAISDVHGNCVALEAVLADIAAMGIKEVVNLGDHVSGPLEARRTAELLMERGFPSIQGDQDRRLVELDQAGTSDRVDYKQLDRNHLNWLSSLPATMIYCDEVFLCHGTPKSDTIYWLDRVTDNGAVQACPFEDVEAEASGIASSLILCGHTHMPRRSATRRQGCRQRWQCRLSGIRRPQACLSQGAGRNPRCLLRHPRTNTARVERDFSVCAVRPHGNGRNGEKERLPGMGKCARHGLGHLTAQDFRKWHITPTVGTRPIGSDLKHSERPLRNPACPAGHSLEASGIGGSPDEKCA